MMVRVAALALISLMVMTSLGCVMQQVPNQNTNAPPVNEVDQSLSNRPPVPVAGPDIAVRPGDVVTLNATGSTDPDNNQLSFVWRQVEGEPDVEFQSTAAASIVSFVAPQVTAATNLKFNLAVIDGFAARFDELVVTVTP